MKSLGWSVAVACLLVFLVATYGCASAPPTNSVLVQCIPLKTWSDAEQDHLRLEYDALPPAAKMRLAFMDYIAMRDADKACKTSTQGKN